jgi:hypothetical protein
MTLALFGSSATALAAVPNELPPQGVYEACGPAESGQKCLDRLAHIRGGGFTLVLNYRQWWASAEDIRRYAETADRLGMKIIWPFDSAPWRMGGDLRARYPELAASCGCSDNESFKRYVVGLVKDLPATWGYYVGDEVPQDQHAQAKAFADQIKALDPTHPTLYVSLEVPATQGANLASFADTADVLAGDYYPVGGTDPVDSVGTVAGDVGRVASTNAKPSGMVLQAFSWEMYPEKQGVGHQWPTAAEMQRMRDLSLERARPSLILWYSYFDIVGSSDPARHWDDLVAAAFAPLPPAPAPVAAPKASLDVPSRFRVRKRTARRQLLRWRLEGSERAELAVFRLARGGRVPVKRTKLRGRSGRVALAKLVKGRPAGRYLVTLRASHPSGGAPAAAQARFRVVR